MEVVVYRLDDNLNPGSRKRLGIFAGVYYSGVFRISLPMYADYYTTNEFGDLVQTTDKNSGIPTKGYYCFEIYDTDDGWTNRRSPLGGFDLAPLPGIRIPSSSAGDYWIGGWDGTWDGLFEYDIFKRRRKFYTVKTIHTKHDYQNIKKPGDYVRYFPVLNNNKVVSKNFTKQIAFNAIPHIDVFSDEGYTKEELKMTNETKKILDKDINLTATCVRLPVLVSHSESVNIEFQNSFSLEKVRDALNNFEGCKVIDERADGGYSTPLEAEGKDETFISRIREDKTVTNGLNMWIVSDNLLRGAALNAVEIAETLIKNDFYGK